MKRFFPFFILIFSFLILLPGCGADDTVTATPTDSSVVTGVSPIIIAVTPTSGKVGATITLQGLGFSSAATANIVTVGGAATSAASYALLNPPVNGAAEAITFTIPTGATAGAAGIFVTVFELTSNSNIQFTVTP